MESQQKADLDEEERIQKSIEKQIAAAMANEREREERGDNDNDEDGDEDEDGNEEKNDFHREEGEKITLGLFSTRTKRNITQVQDTNQDQEEQQEHSNEEKQTESNSEKRKKILPFLDEEFDDISPSTHTNTNTTSSFIPSSSSTTTSSAPMTALQAIMEEDRQRKLRQQSLSNQKTHSNESKANENTNARFSYWLHPNIVVKILNKRLANGKYYKAKGVVEKITGGGYIGEIRILELKDDNYESNNSTNQVERIRVDQEELETVIPKVNSIIIIIIIIIIFCICIFD